MDNLKFNLGIVDDPRSQENKDLDYQHLDLAGAVAINWQEKPQSEWKKYTPREQDGSLSCCGQGSAKAIETFLGTIMSAHPIYRSRSNFPEGGMYLTDVGKLWQTQGSTLETLDTSQFENEIQMNRDINVATPTKTGGYVMVQYNDIDAIAEAIELYKHCILIFHCNKSEWIAIPQYLGEDINFGHCICAVDYTIYNGQKCLIIEDSTGHQTSFDKNGQRIFTENFLKARCAGAMSLTQKIPVPHPTFIFTKTLRLGNVSNDVKMLQVKLNIGADGKFGLKTLSAVKTFQSIHGLTPDGIVGKNTNNVLNLI